MTKKTRYYSRLLLLSTIAFSIVVVLFSVIIYLTFRHSNRIESRRGYDEKLVQLQGQVSAKEDDFYKILLPLYDSRSQATWNRFLMSDWSEISYQDKLNTYELFKNVCLQDNDVRAIFIARLSEKKSYLYTRDGNDLIQVSNNTPFAKELFAASPSRKIYPTQKVLMNIGQSGEHSENLYMLSGGVFKSDSGHNQVKVGICYSANTLGEGIGISTADDKQPLFSIVTDSGQPIYTSTGNYRRNPLSQSKMKTLIDKGTDDRYQSVIQSRRDKQRHYLALYRVNRQALGGVAPMQTALIAGMAVFAIILFSVLAAISNQLMKRRMGALIVGMSEIGNNNLAYRIPIDKRNDEFTAISVQFNAMSEQLLYEIQRSYTFQLEKQTSEFKAMQSIINPHFLYNTLETIRELLDQNGEEDGAEMIFLLSELMKYQIRGGAIASIGEEVKSIQEYISLLSLRYDGEFRYSLKIEDDLLNYKIPKYTLQPILENVFLHGYRAGHNNEFWIIAQKHDQDIIISIRDNGAGISTDEVGNIQAELDSPGHSKIGLSNVHNRLRIAFGAEYGLKLSSTLGQGTTVTIHIPAVFEVTTIELENSVDHE